MKTTRRQRRWALIIGALAALLIVVVLLNAFAHDLLTFAFALALVGLFVAIRLIAAPLAHPTERPFDLWGGLGTHDDLWSGHLPAPPVPRDPPPDVEPSFEGHALDRE